MPKDVAMPKHVAMPSTTIICCGRRQHVF